MDINTKTIIELNEQDVLDIVKEYLASKGYEVTSITTTIATKSVGYGMQESQRSYFKGITASCIK